jgi:hypothetical protein
MSLASPGIEILNAFGVKPGTEDKGMHYRMALWQQHCSRHVAFQPYRLQKRHILHLGRLFLFVFIENQVEHCAV